MTKTAAGYAVAVAIGASLGLITGYFAQAGHDEIGFNFWLMYKQSYLGPWPVFGALVGGGLRYLSVNR